MQLKITTEAVQWGESGYKKAHEVLLPLLRETLGLHRQICVCRHLLAGPNPFSWPKE